MESIGSFEAKTHWSEILRKVEAGKEFVITRRGKAVARLIPEIDEAEYNPAEVIEKIKSLRKSLNLKGIDWKTLRDEGRA